MATVKIRWTVGDLANVMSIYDVQRVWRSTSLSPASWTEITGPGTRVSLVAGQTSYLFDDTSGDPSYYYAVSYYNSVTTLESNLSDPMRADLSGYLTVQDVRDEGFTATMVDDASIIRGIQRATAIIEFPRLNRRGPIEATQPERGLQLISSHHWRRFPARHRFRLRCV